MMYTRRADGRTVTRTLLLMASVVGVWFTGCRRWARPVITTQKHEVPEPAIRVKIAGPAASIPMSVDGPYTIYSFNGQAVLQGSGLGYTQVKLEGDNLRIGSKVVKIDDYCDVVPERNGSVAVDSRYYRGSMRLLRTADGQLLAVNHVRCEDYLKGVLPGELPNRFALEAFKAQAIAARTFALYEKYTAPSRKKWDVVATEGSQMYLGRSVETSKALQAVEATRGIVLTAKLNGGWRIFPTYYSSTCGGRTQSAIHLANIDPKIQPLQGGVVCRTCNISPHHRWPDRVIPASELTQAINKSMAAPLPFQMVTAVNILERAQNCRITRVEVVDSGGQRVTLTGERFRLIVGSRRIPSTWCNVRQEGSNFVFFDGHGLGHGVGMCQYGAEGMAQKGYTAMEILSLYYPKAKLIRAY